MNHPNQFSFSNVRAQKLSALAEMQARLAQIALVEKMTEEHLLRAAPLPLQGILKDEGVISNLFTHGQSSFKLVYDGAPRGLRSKRGVRKWFGQLEKNWNGAARLRISDGEPHRAEICLTVP